ncbi:MAG TPA: ATP-binding protein [Anaerolineales bacterium]|nr:ATP-binding protein [Anaerolineales bacterium]
MLQSLARKLTLAFIVVAIAVAGLVAVIVRTSNAGDFDQLVIERGRGDFSEAIAAYYTAQGTLEGITLANLPLERRDFPPRSGEEGPSGENPERRSLFGLADAAGTIVLPLYPDYLVGAQVPSQMVAAGYPVEVDGVVVGTILTAPQRPGLSPEESAFLQRTDRALALAAGGAILVAVIMGFLLSRTLTGPLNALTEATHRMTAGELGAEVPVTSRDEIGELAKSFNRMSRELARSNNARRQMTADVAHELRTPLTVISGYVESMRDGDLAPTTERMDVIYSEIERLQDLVGDLRVLSQADAGELNLMLEPVEAHSLLRQAAAAFGHQASQNGVALALDTSAPVPTIPMDEGRLAQVFANLLSNALRHTSTGGTITLGARYADGAVMFRVQDTGEGIAPEDLPYIFDRLYRADKSRTEMHGEGTGLGLAIVRAIIEAHGGTIRADSAVGQGTSITFTIPDRPSGDAAEALSGAGKPQTT